MTTLVESALKEDESGSSLSERRNALRKLALIAAVAGITSVAGLGLFGLFEGHRHNTQLVEVVETSNTSSVVNAQTDSITVKLAYFGMSSLITGGVKQEYITLNSPAYFQTVLSTATERHPDLLPMLGAMQILIDGNQAQPNQQLRNKDEIDFIAIQAGG